MSKKRKGILGKLQSKIQDMVLQQMMLTSIRDEFHTIVRYASSITGIQFSVPFAGKMLKTYLSAKGYEYRNANLSNYPLMLVYMSWAKELDGLHLLEGSKLLNTFQSKIPELLNGNEVIAPLHFVFIHHDIAEQETIKYLVINENNNIFYEEAIVFHPMEYKKFLGRTLTEKDAQLLDLASKMIN